MGRNRPKVNGEVEVTDGKIVVGVYSFVYN